ncbi:TRAP transporter large permease [Acuticoccus mangrovi]|uniref:TRAP transporter large permease protein n=1 Tax=Acuticoccus mangrovi TaxID=2796142 RepID=A0A934IQ86_9HYPH|nr:TRAP transporter large permease [Acuticoccus mangrovi]MBJ3776302.1 TRAP transporter large permease [Acuticoccus mangrovi]
MLLAVVIVLLFIFVFLGMDIAFAVGVASLAFIGLSQFEARPINPVLFVQELTAGVDSFSLLAIPMFIFAGELMTKSGVTRRLISLASSLVGHRPGGLANVGITGNLFMAGISGSAIADTAAIGTVLVPEMKQRGYTARYAAGVISAAACVAPIIPPSIMFILLGSIANISVGELFIAGILPGFVMFLALIAMSGFLARRRGLPVEEKLTGPARRAAIYGGLLPLGAPILIVACKVFGIATPTESAAIVVLYTLVLGALVYRDLSLTGFFNAAISAAMTTAVVMMTVATSQIFGSLAVLAGLGRVLTDTILSISDNPYVILMLVNVGLLVLGTIMEPLPLMLILVPILFPLLGGLGIDPIHFGLVMVLNLVLGGVTPPIGLNLFVMARVAKIGVMDVFLGGWPYYLVLFGVLLFLTYVPWVTLVLPTLLMR